MKRIRNVVFVVLAVSCLAASLFGVLPTSSQGNDNYNPWADINDDGIINIIDIVKVALAFGSSGTPLTKATIEYDSGWIDITGRQGQYITVTHGLNITDWNDENIDVSVMGRTSLDGELLRSLGLTDPVQGWNRTYGGTNVDGAWAFMQTSDGGYALAGYTYSFGAGGGDFWLVKTDASGNAQWNKTYGGTGYESLNAFVQTSDGGYALLGSTNSFGAGYIDFWLVKTDSAGNALWNKTYGGTDYDGASVLVQTSDGGYALAGDTQSYGAGEMDFWLVKTDASGNAQWNKTYGGTGRERYGDFVQTSDGGYALTGETGSYGAGSVDAWLVKTDSAGNALWNKTYGGTNFDYSDDLVQTADGGYALAGFTQSFGAGSYDAWLVRTDSAGNTLWNMTYGGTGGDYALDLVKTADGGYAIAGATETFGAGSSDFWLVKTDALGTMQWNKTYGGTNDDTPWALVQTVDDGYAIAGYTYSFGAGNRDIWLVKTDSLGNGLIWVGSTADTIKLYRGTTDTSWNYVRVRVWKPKTP